ncbi:hypothetical protein [Zymomonas mobilis]|uniref:hypothetical protein n=1 Tax=Zymomonas mobilis TaxID=542 RepID=UPI00163A7D1A|nr:hypothetical protein [Zymomonas mobilis]
MITPRARCQMPDARCQMPDARCQMPDARCQMPDARCSNYIWQNPHIEKGHRPSIADPK